jgi:hypothetical protein
VVALLMGTVRTKKKKKGVADAKDSQAVIKLVER